LEDSSSRRRTAYVAGAADDDVAMRYLTAVGFGVLTATATAIVWIVVSFVLPIAVPMFLSWSGVSRSGAGGAGALIGSGSILVAALLGFVGGLAWMLWRR
jgi:hypothetical protein